MRKIRNKAFYDRYPSITLDREKATYILKTEMFVGENLKLSLEGAFISNEREYRIVQDILKERRLREKGIIK